MAETAQKETRKLEWCNANNIIVSLGMLHTLTHDQIIRNTMNSNEPNEHYWPTSYGVKFDKEEHDAKKQQLHKQQ